MKESKELAVILMGSEADKGYGQQIASELKKFGVPYHKRGGSAHTAPWKLLNVIREYENKDLSVVYITVAGRSDALSAFTDGQTRFPVIAAPPQSDFGLAKYLSSVDVPSGIGCTLAIYPGQVAIHVAKIFALSNPEIAENIAKFHQQTVEGKYLFDQSFSKENG